MFKICDKAAMAAHECRPIQLLKQSAQFFVADQFFYFANYFCFMLIMLHVEYHGLRNYMPCRFSAEDKAACSLICF